MSCRTVSRRSRLEPRVPCSERTVRRPTPSITVPFSSAPRLLPVRDLRPPPIPIAAVLQAPFVASLSAAPARGAVAFVLREGGSRNLYLAEPPAYTPKKLTRTTRTTARRSPTSPGRRMRSRSSSFAAATRIAGASGRIPPRTPRE